MIKTSLEWANYEASLMHKTHNLVHGREVRKMIGNIGISVTELSKAEVKFRQGNRYATEDILTKIAQDLEMVEEYLLVAALIG